MLQAREISVPTSSRSAFLRALKKIAFPRARVPKTPGTRERKSRNARPALVLSLGTFCLGTFCLCTPKDSLNIYTQKPSLSPVEEHAMVFVWSLGQRYVKKKTDICCQIWSCDRLGFYAETLTIFETLQTVYICTSCVRKGKTLSCLSEER